MPKIAVHDTVVHNGKIYVPGEDYEVDAETAKALKPFTDAPKDEKLSQPKE
jgi:hypothetical protein